MESQKIPIIIQINGTKMSKKIDWSNPRLSMYIQDLLLNDIESLIPNNCNCGETNCTGYDPNILVSTRK